MDELPNTKPLDEDARYLMVLVDAIETEGRIRDAGGPDYPVLRESIASRGLIQAITVREIADKPGAFKLVQGGNRLQAHKDLGIEYIKADVVRLPDEEAFRIERDENLARNGLTAREMALSVGSFLDDWQADNGPICWGGDRSSSDGDSKMQGLHLENPFEVLSEKTGKSKRTIQDYHSLHQHLGKDVLTQLKGSAIEDNAAQLKALAKLPPSEQSGVVRALQSGDAKTVKEAVDVAANRPPEVIDPDNEWMIKFRELWHSGSKKNRKSVRAMFEAGEL